MIACKAFLVTVGTYCLTGSKDRSIRLWNPHKGAHIKAYQGHGYDVRGLAVTQDNSRFVSCGGDKCIFLWDVASGSIVRRFKGHDAAANDIQFAANEQVRLKQLSRARFLRCLFVRNFILFENLGQLRH